MNRSSSSLLSTQALRGFAALYVVVFHSGLTLAHADVPALAWPTSHVIKRGHVGVNMFLVISGFIIAWVAVLGSKGPKPANEFPVKRTFRLAPPYWLMSVLYSTWSNLVSAGVLLTSLAFVPQANVDVPYFGYSPLYVGRSLNYEVFFYTSCAAGLAPFGRRVPGLVALALFTMTIIVLFWHSGVVQDNPEALYHQASPLQAMAVNPLMLEFLLGAGLAWLYAAHRHRLTPVVARALMAIGVATSVISVVSPVSKFGLLARGLSTGVLLFGMVAMEYCGELRMPRVAVWLGELSCALYLAHPAVIEATHCVVGRLAPEWIGTQLIVFAVNLAPTLALAVLVHRCVELSSIALGRHTVEWMRSRRHAWRTRLSPQKP